MRDNFLIYTPVSIEKNKKYRLEYYLYKPFMVNSANEHFYLSLLLSKHHPDNKVDNKFQLIKNRILHADINLTPLVGYKEDTVIIEPRPDLWQKFSIEFIAEDDFEFLGLERNITHPYGLTEVMEIDNIQLHLVEDNTDENQELTAKINDLAKQIQFETGSAKLTLQSKAVLDSLSIYLKNINQQTSDFFIEINGHTDNEGNAESNILLSEQRAETVKTFFQSKNDSETSSLQILRAGFGNKQPLVSNDTEEGKAINRRVEIKLLNKKTAKEILFEPLSFEEALQKAKKENKLIFIDAYTSWCKPCKLMDRDVFTDSVVARVFNENFINLKIDMESEMGKPLNRKYEVQGYPTFLFVDFEGNLKHRKEGFMNISELSNYGREVVQLKSEKNIESNDVILEKRLYEKAKIDYLSNSCNLDFVEAYFNLINENDEVQKVKFNYMQCLGKTQDFSSKQVRFLLGRLVDSRKDITYTFYLANKSKFEKNYGDSLSGLESYLAETFFFQDADTLIKKNKDKEKLTSLDIKNFEEIVNTYSSFSEKIEKESKEKGFERPIKNGFVDYMIYVTAIKFYSQHKELDKFSDYLIKYNQVEKLESYRDDLFKEMDVPLRNFGIYTTYYLEQEGKQTEVLRELSLIWTDLNNKNYLSNYDSYFTAAKAFYSNKEKQEAQKMLQRAFELKNETFDEEKYKELETQINQL